MNRFEKRILEFIRRERLLEAGDAVIAAFSGGADSTCLLHVLCRLKNVLGIRLFCVHVNHGLRGEESRRDAQFCRKEAEALSVPFFLYEGNARERAERDGCSVEEAGRALRSECFEALREKLRKELEKEGFCGRIYVATAHQADDQAETILFHLLRGTGLRGLSGMDAKRGMLIRPLLCADRQEILAQLTAGGIPYVTDSSNLSDDYTRNYLRNQILPRLCENVNARAAQNLLRAGQICGEADRYLQDEARAFLEKAGEPQILDTDAPCVRTVDALRAEKSGPWGAQEANARKAFSDSVRLLHAGLKEKPPIFRRYVIMEALRRLDAPLRDIGERHLLDLDKALFCGRGFHIDLPGGLYAENGYRETVLGRRGTVKRAEAR